MLWLSELSLKAAQNKLYVLPQLARRLCPKNAEKTHIFLAVCVVFSHARINFQKKIEVKHTIYFERPKGATQQA